MCSKESSLQVCWDQNPFHPFDKLYHSSKRLKRSDEKAHHPLWWGTWYSSRRSVRKGFYGKTEKSGQKYKHRNSTRRWEKQDRKMYWMICGPEIVAGNQRTLTFFPNNASKVSNESLSGIHGIIHTSHPMTCERYRLPLVSIANEIRGSRNVAAIPNLVFVRFSISQILDILIKLTFSKPMWIKFLWTPLFPKKLESSSFLESNYLWKLELEFFQIWVLEEVRF